MRVVRLESASLPTRAARALLLACALLACAAGLARAQDPEPFVGNRPGATLLLPYFEVALDEPAGATTLFSINNASATAVLSHVTVWSDLGVPVLGFNVYLTGYDMQTIDLRAVLTGTLPTTATDGQDPNDTISPQGRLSQDINFPGCTGQLPLPAMPASFVAHVQAALTGAPSAVFDGRCASRNLGTPRVARGYVTVDAVTNCTLRSPTDPGYFQVDATTQNVLWGDYQYIDASQAFAVGDALVSVYSPRPSPFAPGDYTFYGRLVGFSGIDQREPLSTTFATRFVAAKDYKQEDRATLQQILPPATELLVWRDPKSLAAPFSCGSTPSWYPLGQRQVLAFDEQENVESASAGGATPFGAVTQRVALGGAALPVTPASGWLHLNLNTQPAAQVTGLSDAFAAQAWVTVLHRVYQGPTGGRYDAGFRAIRLDSARKPNTGTIPF